MKYHVEKDIVQETLVIPLYARKMCSERFPILYRDETAIRLMEQIDFMIFPHWKKNRKANCSNLDFWKLLCGRMTSPMRYRII